VKKCSGVFASVRLKPYALESRMAAATGQPASAGSSPARSSRKRGAHHVGHVVDDVVEALPSMPGASSPTRARRASQPSTPSTAVAAIIQRKAVGSRPAPSRAVTRAP